MVKIVSVDQIVEIERATDAAGVSYPRMMESAGHAVAQVVKELLIKHGLMQVLVLVGPGNNGGDGLVAARVLKTETDAAVSCYLYRERPE
nr:bifunctional ADP-dependent NAD(P)H-hydrate dehydratase/NAD(P)H-hydrate epimerase [Anaerolineae bacterium]